MPELGRLLSEARNAKELSLADVEAATRVRQKYLAALEQGDYAKLPHGATTRGFLQIYAQFLGLSGDEAVRLYEKESGNVSHLAALAAGQLGRNSDYRPLDEQLVVPSGTGGSGRRWLIVLLLVVVAAAAVYWAVARGNPLTALLELVRPQPVATALVGSGPKAPAATRTADTGATVTPPAPPPTVLVATPTPLSGLLPLPIPTTEPTATATPTPVPTATPGETMLSLVVRTSQQAWLLVTVDGKVVQEGVLERDVTRTWEANSWIAFRTGNAGGLTMAINGRDLGSMGTVGQVVERAWVLIGGTVADAVLGTGAAAPATVTPTATMAPVR